VSDEVSAAIVERLLALNGLQAGEGGAEPSQATGRRTSRARSCTAARVLLHEPLRDYDGRTAALLDTIRATGETVGDLPSGDVVHVDFHHRNVLLDGGAVTAVIDWEGCRSGDAACTSSTLAFGCRRPRAAAARDQVWTRLAAARIRKRCVSTSRTCPAQVDWSIRHRTAEDVDHCSVSRGVSRDL